jgi:Spy/CpxP family protein refolding chaperone
MKRTLIVPLLVAVALAAASCGGGSGNDSSSGSGAAGAGSNSSAGNGGNGQRPGRPQLTDSQLSCLEQQGVTLPGQGNGGPPGGGNGAPGEQLTDEQRQQLQQRREKMTAAFEKCGIPAPQFGRSNGQGSGQPQNGGSSQ